MIELKNNNIQLQIYPDDGCRIINLFVYGYPILRPWQEGRFAFQYGCFPMVPWVGRIKDAVLKYDNQTYQLPANKPPHAMHGMACFSSWKCMSVTKTSAKFNLPLDHPWPWKGNVYYEIELDNNKLKLTLTIKTDEANFPAAAGWHPWFNKHLVKDKPEMRIVFLPSWQRKTGKDEIPEQEKIPPQIGPWDDCFGFEDQLNVNLEWENQLQLDIHSSSNHLVIFDKQPDATCINPMTEAPNDINLCPTIVTKDQPLIISTIWEFKKL